MIARRTVQSTSVLVALFIMLTATLSPAQAQLPSTAYDEPYQKLALVIFKDSISFRIPPKVKIKYRLMRSILLTDSKRAALRAVM